MKRFSVLVLWALLARRLLIQPTGAAHGAG